MELVKHKMRDLNGACGSTKQTERGTHAKSHELESLAALHFTNQDNNILIKTEDETDEVMIKQELDIGPTILQPKTTCYPLQSQAGSLDQHPNTSRWVHPAPGPFCTVLAQRALQTNEEGDHTKTDFRVSPKGSFVLDMTATNMAYQGILRNQPCDHSNTKDTSVNSQKESQHSYCVQSLIKYDCKTNILRTKPDVQTGGKRYECDYCRYITTRKCNVINHIRTHTGEKPYKCKMCEYSASRQSNLKYHLSTHTGVKPYKCTECDYSSFLLGSLKRHMRTHTGEKPYKCGQCEYSASQQSHLKEHMHIHTGEKPYECGQCAYSASQLSYLKRHMRTHMCRNHKNIDSANRVDFD